jgi:hypothetical protein
MELNQVILIHVLMFFGRYLQVNAVYPANLEKRAINRNGNCARSNAKETKDISISGHAGVVMSG